MNDIDSVAQFLDDLIQGNIFKPRSNEFEKRLRFVIARKWNSWYPCYFVAPGGCYGIITRDENMDVKENSGTILIDPGFDFSDNLRELYNIGPHDIKSVLISHYHPDHMTGLFQLLTLNKESKYPCSYYLNKTAFDYFKIFQGKYNKIYEIPDNQIIKLAEYKNKKANILAESISIKAIRTYHEEIGNVHNSIGFRFLIDTRIKGKINFDRRELVLLGDTDGNEDYIDSYLGYLKTADIAVLHLGCYSEKNQGEGNKHLYKSGLIDIINCINCVKGGRILKSGSKYSNCRYTPAKINGQAVETKVSNLKRCKFHKENYFQKLKCVIISELGLEMAPIPDLLGSLKGFKWFNRLYPLALYLKFINKDDEYIYELFKHRQISYDQMMIPRQLMATKALESLDELFELKKCDLENKAWLSDWSCFSRDLTRDESRLKEFFNFSIFLSFFFIAMAMKTIQVFDWAEIHFRRNHKEVLDEALKYAGSSANNFQIFMEELSKVKDEDKKEKVHKIIKMMKYAYEEFNPRRFGVEYMEFIKDLQVKKLELLYSNSSKLCCYQDFIRKNVNFDDFINLFETNKVISEDMAIIISHLNSYIENFLVNIYYDTYIKNDNRAYVLKNLYALSKTMYESLSVFGGKSDEFYCCYSFIGSISLFSGENARIRDLIFKKFKESGGEAFIDLICLISYLLKKNIEIFEKKKKTDKAKLYKKFGKKIPLTWRSNRQLMEILRSCSEGDVKYILSDLGLEIDISQLEIKDAKNKWVNLENVKQETSLRIRSQRPE